MKLNKQHLTTAGKEKKLKNEKRKKKINPPKNLKRKGKIWRPRRKELVRSYKHRY